MGVLCFPVVLAVGGDEGDPGETAWSCIDGDSGSVSAADGVYCGSVSSAVESALWLGVVMNWPTRSSSSELSSPCSSSFVAS